MGVEAGRLNARKGVVEIMCAKDHNADVARPIEERYD